MNYKHKLLLLLGASILMGCSPKYSVEDNKVLIEDGENILSITPNSERSVRVQYYAKGAELADTSYIFTESFEVPKFDVSSSMGKVTVSLPEMSAEYKDNTLSFYNGEGELILEEEKGGRTIESSMIREEATYKVAQSFISPKSERIFGTGQFQDGFLNVRDLPRRLTQVNTQISLPFIYSSAGYGLLWHNYGMTEFNPADNKIALKAGMSGEAKKVKISSTDGEETIESRDGSFSGTLNVAEDGTYNLMLDVCQVMSHKYFVKVDGQVMIDLTNMWLPPTTSWRMDLKAGDHDIEVMGSKGDNPVIYYRKAEDKTVFRSPVAESVDYTVIAGSADQAISTYRDLSGRAPLMPKWALGFIHCRERYTTQEQLLRNAREFRKREIPIDLIVQDWNYWDTRGWNCLEFDLSRYPKPEEMVKDLHNMNMKLMVSVWPRLRLNPVHKAYKDLHDKFLPNDVGFLDLFNPTTQKLYGDNMYNLLGVMGIDGWWLDGSEPQDDGLLGIDTYLGPGEKMRIAYPLFVNSAVYNAMRSHEPNKRPFLFTRSAFLGQQRYGSTSWSGDVGNNWETLKRQIHAGLNFSMAGIPYWTFDAGGFFRPGGGQYTDQAYHQRFVRWLQFATFAPLQRVHGFITKTEIWRFGDLVYNESVRLINLRYRFLPYIYSEAANITYNNGTIMRPLVMDFPKDEKALDATYEYMFGPNLLVAPVVEPDVKSWKVYLPENKEGWFDFWTSEKYNGGSTIDRAITISETPLFVKGGSIIPMGELQQYSSEKKNPTLNIRIYPGADASYLLYEDEGENNDYEKGEFSKINISWNEATKTVTLSEREGSYEGMPTERVFRFTLISSEKGAGLNESEYYDAEVKYNGGKVEYKF